MIKHGKVYQIHKSSKGRPNAHLAPIMDFVTKGVADAKEDIILQPMACDVKGAKRHNGQQCVIAKALKRIHKPQAVAVGRSLAYAVFNGLAIRFQLPMASRKLVEEFDQRGRARNAPVELRHINKSWKLGRPMQQAARPPRDPNAPKRARSKRLNVRAAGGGISR